mmetsp:Transcript_38742/g.123071  ORF Transcript_38742/g.123071 Transcript_38742/m.123071 type:complete len:207 (+) Transcript_38742:958-1578(+)
MPEWGMPKIQCRWTAPVWESLYHSGDAAAPHRLADGAEEHGHAEGVVGAREKVGQPDAGVGLLVRFHVERVCKDEVRDLDGHQEAHGEEVRPRPIDRAGHPHDVEHVLQAAHFLLHQHGHEGRHEGEADDGEDQDVDVGVLDQIHGERRRHELNLRHMSEAGADIRALVLGGRAEVGLPHHMHGHQHHVPFLEAVEMVSVCVLGVT